MNTANKMVGGWSAEKICMVLTMKSVESASKGRPCPVAMMVIARIEAALEGK